MIEYFDGTVFNTDAKAIVNTVNCIGVMSAGVALEYGLRYPEMLKDYENKCKEKTITIGKIDYYKNNQITIINFPTKWHFKYPSKIEWIIAGLKDFVKTYKQNNIESVAFTKLGTLNGHLDWNEVKKIMEQYLNPLPIKVYICLDKKQEAEGVEKKMLDVLNTTSMFDLKKEIKINKNQENILKKNIPFDRFWKIKELDGVGISLYSNLHRYCYIRVNNNSEQISMF